MSNFWDRARGNGFAPSFFVMWLLLGVLLVSALKAQQNVRKDLPSSRFPELAREYMVKAKTLEKLEEEIRLLRDKSTEMENALATGSQKSQLLNDSLQEAKVLAGLSALSGPGVEVLLTDKSTEKRNEGDPALLNMFAIHDFDILRVVNELRAAGAEAISVNGQRLGVNGWIRCSGPVICVNDIRMAPPFRILAIGDPQTLTGALKIPGGVLSDIENADPNMVKIISHNQLTIPGFAGSTKFKYAKPVTEAVAKSEAAQ